MIWSRLIAWFGTRRSVAAKFEQFELQLGEAVVMQKLMAKGVQAEMLENIELNRMLRESELLRQQLELDLQTERRLTAWLRQALRKYKIVA